MKNNTKPTQTIIKIEKGKEMPIYLYEIPLIFRGQHYHLLYSIIHDISQNLIETRGQLSISATGEKTIFNNSEKKVYSDIAISNFKKEIKQTTTTLKDKLDFKETQPFSELEFKPKAKEKDILKAIKKSNMNEFNTNSPSNLIDKIN